MTTVSTKTKIGYEDINWGVSTETFTRPTSSGGEISLHKIPYIETYFETWEGSSYLENLADTIKINADYASGDEDATINFNNGMAQIKLEYLSGETIRQFAINERIYINKTASALADFADPGDVTWACRSGLTMYFPTWASGLKYGVNGWFETENQWNDLTCEMSAISAFTYCVTANAKAKVFAADFYVLKQDPCVTANELYGCSTIICSDVDPGGNLFYGIGYKATCQDMGDFSSLRQHTAYLAHGNKGWKYGYLYMDIDGSTVLFCIDQYGNVYNKGYIEITEMAAPGGYTDRVRIFCQDNGAGKTKLMAIFPTGAAQQLAIEA